MRDEFDAQVAGGVLGADWYNRVRDFTGKVGGGSRHSENRLAEALALFSAQANPDTNMNWAIQALNQYRAGLRGSNFPRVKTGKQTETFLKGMASDDQIKLGKKTQVYHDSLNPNIQTPITGTNDIWHGRAFGYKNNDGKPFSRGFTPQEHVFLDNETVLAVDRANKAKLGGRSNWTAAEIQAAANLNLQKDLKSLTVILTMQLSGQEKHILNIFRNILPTVQGKIYLEHLQVICLQ